MEKNKENFVMIKKITFLIKYSKFNIPYKEYKLLFCKGNDEIGTTAKYLRKKLNLNSFTNAELEKIYFVFKLQLLKTYHFNNFKFEEINTNELIKFLNKEAHNRLNLFEAIEFYNITINSIPKTFPLFSRFIYSNNSNWIKINLPFNTKETAYFINSESEIKSEFYKLFKNKYLLLEVIVSKTNFCPEENKIFYECDIIDQNKNLIGKVYYFEFSKSFQN